MCDSNISFQSNIQPINPGKKFDKSFLRHVYDIDALNKLRKTMGSMNTEDYMFNQVQIQIVHSTLHGGYLNRDLCFGPVKNSRGNIELAIKPLQTEEELRFFDPSDESQVEVYGYNKSLQQGERLFDVQINGAVRQDEYQQEIIKDNIQKELKINLVSTVKKDNCDESGTDNSPVKDEKEEAVKEDESTVFTQFEEATQEDVIKAANSKSIIVDAGPGTGKTYTLIRKLDYMVTEQEIDPEGILVLCFTNAAVDEIKVRLKTLIDEGGDRGLSNIDVRTFHSFAWWLIGQANELFQEESWKPITLSLDQNYDFSLKTATNIMKKYGKDIVSNWEYFIVDEAQDLTNTLARFVLQIIHSCIDCCCGFTVLGDACQAIYDYTKKSDSDPMMSEEFYQELLRLSAGKAALLKLNKNYRQSNELLTLANEFRSSILAHNDIQIQKAVKELLSRADTLDCSSVTIQEEDIDAYRADDNICLMLRNNGQTLRVSSNLRKRGIHHILNVNVSDRNFAPWITDVFFDIKNKYITFSEFDKRLSASSVVDHASAQEIWERFCHVLHNDGEELKVSDILEGIAYSRVDDSILRTTKSGNIIVSNIHRSKGREYGSVILDREFAESVGKGNIEIGECKTLYVGITRPKNKLFIAPLQKKGELRLIEIFASNNKRWGKVNTSKQIVYLEFDSSKDLKPEMFAYSHQNELQKVRVDDGIVLRRIISENVIRYQIIHQETENILGYITGEYINDFMSYMKIDETSLYEMPDEIDDLYVSGVYSQIVDSNYLEVHPEIKAVTPNGVWRWIEIVGVGHAKYGVY